MRKPQIHLAQLLLLPLVFALGWWTREINYEQDVRKAIDQQALDSGGVFIPEMGIIRGNGITVKKLKSMSADAKKEMERRLQYYAENFPQDESDDADASNRTVGFPRTGFSGSGFGFDGAKVEDNKK